MTGAKNQARTGTVARLQTSMGRANQLSQYAIYYDDPGRINSLLSRFQAVTADDVRRVAQQYLTKGSPCYIAGRLNLDTWDDKATGQKRSKLKVVGETLQLLGAKGASGGNGGSGYSERPQQQSRPPQQRSGPPQGASAAPADDYQEDDDIPF